jgi:hypothetical protein
MEHIYKAPLPSTNRPASTSTTACVLKAAALALVVTVVTACGGGASTETNPDGGTYGTQTTYTGPPPEHPDVQAFRVNVWENIRHDDRCGQCHDESSTFPFARSDDVNLAYDLVTDLDNPLVDVDNPGLSRLVERVGNNHNCWLGQTAQQACADIMTTWIQNWVGGSGITGREILLVAPTLKDPGQSKNFPDSPTGYGQLYNLLTDVNEGNCGRCHSSEAGTPISPYFGSGDMNESYDAAKSKINLDVPEESRFVIRLGEEFHNCWSGNCDDDAQDILDAIIAFAGPLPTDEVNSDEVTFSKAMQITDGIIASGGQRHEANQIAFWEFKTGTGTTAYDTSGVGDAINLSLVGNIEWVGGWGINIKDGKAQGPTGQSEKIHGAITDTGEYSVEAWVAPANVTQDDAYIISYSGNSTTRNFTLGQTLYNYDFLNRNSTLTEPDEITLAANGRPGISTPDADEVLQATLQHVVMNFDPVTGRSIYVNGELSTTADPVVGGTLSGWNPRYAVVLGDDTSNDRQWQGVIRMVAIHNRTLTEEQIQQNFAVGVGEKFFLLFYLGDVLTGFDQPYVLLEVSQFDTYSYLFNEPRLISLNPDDDLQNVVVKGIRIGVNGRLAGVGQGFQKIDTTAPNFVGVFTPETGMPLSRQGTIISVEKGPGSDEFFLAFDDLNGVMNYYTEPDTLQPGDPPDRPRGPDIGMRTFEEINATLAAATTVSTQEPKVLETFNRVRQQLPTAENANGFLAAHQMAIAQLAIGYCNALVDDANLRDAYWDTISFPGPQTNPSEPATMADLFGLSVNRDDVLNPLISRLLLPETPASAIGLSTQPDVAATKTELNNLIGRLNTCYDPATETGNGSCSDANRSNIILKSICAAAMGSGGMLIQ